MSMSIKRVPAIVMCLMHLHNHYINHCGRKCDSPLEEDERRIQYLEWHAKSGAVTLNKNRCPEDLLGYDHNFDDVAKDRQKRRAIVATTSMHQMMKIRD